MESEWHEFLDKKGKYLLGVKFIEAITMNFTKVFYLSSFIKLLETDTIQLICVIDQAMFIIVSLIVVKFKIERINLLYLFGLLLISYPVLLLICYGYDTYKITNSFLCFSPFFGVMSSRIRSENVVQEHRVRYNNYSELTASIGNLIGGLLAMVPFFYNHSILVSWFVIYIIMDMSIFIIMILIKRGILDY